MTNEELAALAANGDDAAMAELISVVTPVARAKAAAFSCGWVGSDDLIQEGMFGLLDAVKTYDSQKDASFLTYANTCIHNRIVSAARSSQSGKNRILSGAMSFSDDSAEKVSAADSDPQDILTGNDAAERIMRVLISSLSGLERSVIELRLCGNSYTEIAQKLSCSEKAVDNALQRVKTKLRSKLN